VTVTASDGTNTETDSITVNVTSVGVGGGGAPPAPAPEEGIPVTDERAGKPIMLGIGIVGTVIAIGWMFLASTRPGKRRDRLSKQFVFFILPSAIGATAYLLWKSSIVVPFSAIITITWTFVLLCGWILISAVPEGGMRRRRVKMLMWVLMALGVMTMFAWSRGVL